MVPSGSLRTIFITTDSSIVGSLSQSFRIGVSIQHQLKSNISMRASLARFCKLVKSATLQVKVGNLVRVMFGEVKGTVGQLLDITDLNTVHLKPEGKNAAASIEVELSAVLKDAPEKNLLHKPQTQWKWWSSVGELIAGASGCFLLFASESHMTDTVLNVFLFYLLLVTPVTHQKIWLGCLLGLSSSTKACQNCFTSYAPFSK